RRRQHGGRTVGPRASRDAAVEVGGCLKTENTQVSSPFMVYWRCPAAEAGHARTSLGNESTAAPSGCQFWPVTCQARGRRLLYPALSGGAVVAENAVDISRDRMADQCRAGRRKW